MTEFDVVVVGGGHAGIEATHAAWKLGVKTAMLTMDINAIGRMSCNPAVGGVAKGQIVRDIDALGGLMGILTDKAGIQFRMLNMSKGPAVWGLRAQCDMKYYSEIARETIAGLPGLTLIEGELTAFERMPDGRLQITLLNGDRYVTRSIVVTSGTFLASKMFTGLETSVGGRVGEPSADKLSECLAANGIALRRLKTGTPSRLDPDSIDFGECDVQHGDAVPWPFSDRHSNALRNDCVCWITRTNIKTHDILRSGFKDSPMFSGRIHGKGPRYCPSIEDKINRFGDRDGHQLFLEPEQADIGRVYINGFSSSLPADIQLAAIHTIPGLTETSTNMAIIRTVKGHLTVHSLTRSSIDEAKMVLADSIRYVFELAGARYSLSGAYSGWTPKLGTPMIKVLEDTYRKLFGKDLKITATHGGLECAIMGAKYPNWEMVSIGPTIVHPHSPDERVKIDTVAQTWEFLKAVLEDIPEK